MLAIHVLKNKRREARKEEIKRLSLSGKKRNERKGTMQ